MCKWAVTEDGQHKVGFCWVRFWVWFFKKADFIERSWVRLAKKYFFTGTMSRNLEFKAARRAWRGREALKLGTAVAPCPALGNGSQPGAGQGRS